MFGYEKSASGGAPVAPAGKDVRRRATVTQSDSQRKASIKAFPSVQTDYPLSPPEKYLIISVETPYSIDILLCYLLGPDALLCIFIIFKWSFSRDGQCPRNQTLVLLWPVFPIMPHVCNQAPFFFLFCPL